MREGIQPRATRHVGSVGGTGPGLLCTLAGLALGLLLQGSAAAAPPAEGVVSQEVSVSGAIKTPLLLKVDDLKAFPTNQIATATVTRRAVGNGSPVDTPSTVRGVRLTAVLDRAGLASVEPNDWKHTVVLATATDGYRVVFSWPELFDTEVGGAVLVVFERDGQPLTDREGHIALVSARDLRTGPRSVHWLSHLSVSVLNE